MHATPGIGRESFAPFLPPLPKPGACTPTPTPRLHKRQMSVHLLQAFIFLEKRSGNQTLLDLPPTPKSQGKGNHSLYSKKKKGQGRKDNSTSEARSTGGGFARPHQIQHFVLRKTGLVTFTNTRTHMLSEREATHWTALEAAASKHISQRETKSKLALQLL